MSLIKATNKNILVVFNYLKSDLNKKKRSFLIGLTSIFLVVFFICVLMNTIENSPVIFLRLCEDQSGEIDVILIPQIDKKDVKKLDKNSTEQNE
jgi:hypothetical protein